MDKPLKLKFRIKTNTEYARGESGDLDFEHGTVYVSLMLNHGEVFTQAFPFKGYDAEDRVAQKGTELVEQKFANVLGSLMCSALDV